MRIGLVFVLLLAACSAKRGLGDASRACEAAKEGARVEKCYALAMGPWYEKERAEERGKTPGAFRHWEWDLATAIKEECSQRSKPVTQCVETCRRIAKDDDFVGSGSARYCREVRGVN